MSFRASSVHLYNSNRCRNIILLCHIQRYCCINSIPPCHTQQLSLHISFVQPCHTEQLLLHKFRTALSYTTAISAQISCSRVIHSSSRCKSFMQPYHTQRYPCTNFTRPCHAQQLSLHKFHTALSYTTAIVA